MVEPTNVEGFYADVLELVDMFLERSDYISLLGSFSLKGTRIRSRR